MYLTEDRKIENMAAIDISLSQIEKKLSITLQRCSNYIYQYEVLVVQRLLIIEVKRLLLTDRKRQQVYMHMYMQNIPQQSLSNFFKVAKSREFD